MQARVAATFEGRPVETGGSTRGGSGAGGGGDVEAAPGLMGSSGMIEFKENRTENCQVKWEKIEIETGDARYWALVGRGLMAKTGELARAALTRNRCAIIADENSARLFATRVSESLATSGFQPITIVAPSGESSKSLRETERICDEMSAAGLDRQSFVIGLGGGVIGDLSGFVAAIFLRGVPHIQIPTTLLAMVDSAIGGMPSFVTRRCLRCCRSEAKAGNPVRHPERSEAKPRDPEEVILTVARRDPSASLGMTD